MVRLIVAVFAVTCLSVLVASCSKKQVNSEFQQQWQTYKQSFYQDGRVIDTGNGNITHTEGQGYAMLFAIEADDHQTFSELWKWTQRTLARSDNLFSWKYVPCDTSDKRCIADPNNASDGEVLIAWALLRAERKWGKRYKYGRQAQSIIKKVRETLIIENDEYTLLIPGEYGFINKESLQINLSYWVFPAFEMFYQHTKEPIWRMLNDTGLKLMREARFGQTQLNSDWTIMTENRLTLDGAISQEYGYNACRIPLHFIWNYKDLDSAPELLESYLSLWQTSPVPATVNLVNNEVAEYQYSEGMRAVHYTTVNLLNHQDALVLPSIDSDTDYFSASLMLLSRLALLDNRT